MDRTNGIISNYNFNHIISIYAVDAIPFLGNRFTKVIELAGEKIQKMGGKSKPHFIEFRFLSNVSYWNIVFRRINRIIN